VEVDGDHAVEPGGVDQVGDQPRRNGFPPARPAILAGITEIGNDRGQTLSAGATTGVGEKEELDQVRLVGWTT
jgi:hypothetical protein